MPKQCFVKCVIAAGLLVANAGFVWGQDYPTKPIRVVTDGAGGGNDIVSRVIKDGLDRTGSLGQPIIIENRRGGSGSIASDIVAKSAPDGYTLLVYSNTLWTLPFINKVPYEVRTDFSQITTATTAPNLLVVHPSLPVKTIKDLIALAKARPGELNFCSGALGSSPHLAGELFKIMASVNMQHVLYGGGARAIAGLLVGEVQMFFATVQGVKAHVTSGRLRAVAVTSATPFVLAPGVPTIAATLPGFETGQVIGVHAPAKTPKAIIDRLNQEIVRVLARADVKEKFLNLGVEATPSSPEQFAAMMRTDMAKMGKLIKDADIRAK